jgi:hypothetical protein
MNKKLTNLLLLGAFAAIFLTTTLPLYNSGGYNNFGLTGFINEYYKNKSLGGHLETARSIEIDAAAELVSFNGISEDYLDKMARSAPQKKDILRSINDIYNIGLENKLDVTGFTFTKPTPSPAQTFQHPKKVYEISFMVAGDYYNFFNFMRGIESSLEIYNIKNINISPVEKDGTEDEEENLKDESLRYTITLETYEING